MNTEGCLKNLTARATLISDCMDCTVLRNKLWLKQAGKIIIKKVKEKGERAALSASFDVLRAVA